MEEVMDERCTVNHELEQGLILAAIDRQAATEALLRRAVRYLNSAMRESSWSDAEHFVDEAEEYLARAANDYEERNAELNEDMANRRMP
jgi:hypothetical protein